MPTAQQSISISYISKSKSYPIQKKKENPYGLPGKEKKHMEFQKKKERKKKNPMEFLQKKRKSFRIFLFWCYSTPSPPP